MAADRFVAAERSFGVLDPVWMAVWWPWLLVWGITAVSLVAAVAMAVTHWRRHRAPAAARLYSSCFYLDDKAVMDLYRQYGGKYKGALRHEVEERISSNRELGISIGHAPVEGSGKRGVNSEIFRKYIEEDEPITVIGIIIDVLDHAGDIVDVDLRKREITYGRALDEALDADDDRPTNVGLRGLDTFVSIRGRFRATDRTSAVTTFEAPYGDLTDPADGDPHVRVTCAASGLRGDTVPPVLDAARCLGRVEDWDQNTSRLIVRPIAIFG